MHKKQAPPFLKGGACFLLFCRLGGIAGVSIVAVDRIFDILVFIEILDVGIINHVPVRSVAQITEGKL
jgi:hypothetical protein